MGPRPSQVAEDVAIRTASSLQRIGQDWETVEGALLIDRPGDLRDLAVVPG
jgi:hypothetical protein